MVVVAVVAIMFMMIGYGRSMSVRTASIRYTITDLGDLPGGLDHSHATAINNVGMVVGYSGSHAGTRAFIWQVETGMVDLGVLDGMEFSRADGINDLGQVVGESFGPYVGHASLWQSSKRIVDLGALPQFSGNSHAWDINNAGQVVGQSSTESGKRAFVWQDGQGLIDLGTAENGSETTVAKSINNLGEVAGVSTLSTHHPFGWNRAIVWNLGDKLDSRQAVLDGVTGGAASAINDSGQVVGTMTSHRGESVAFLWSNDAGVQELGHLSNFFSNNSSEALGINSNGQIVGWSSLKGGVGAFIWDRKNGLRNLSDLIDPELGWTLRSANDINDDGYIIGYGHNGNTKHGFLLSPIRVAN